jgi:hypothetical protein
MSPPTRASGARSGQAGDVACPHEQAIVDLVVAGRWFDDSDDALRAHAVECRACAETIELARLLQDDQKALCAEAPVPSAGAVWWRATIRARAEAARAAGQPITLLQGIAAAAAVGLFVALVGAWWRSVAPGGIWFERFDDLISRSASIPVAVVLSLLLVLAACLIVAPIAVYLATGDDFES